MRRPLLPILALALFAGCAPETAPPAELPPELEDGDFAYVNTTDPLSPDDERLAFHLPPGFEAQLFAAEPDIDKPMNIAFDAKGRLWVTQSRAYPFPADEGAGRDRLTILEDTDGDGRADSFTDFADDLNIPIGITPVKDGAIVFSIPNIYRLYDTDGDDRADRREVLAGPFGYEDTHGMVNNLLRGLDGWIHAGHGFRNSSTPTGTDGSTITMVSGNTFRFRQDGTGLETTTTGRVNPFGFAYDDRGYLYGVDCHTIPIYQLIRGGDYPHFGKTPTGIGFPPTMMRHNHGPTAIAGFVFYTSNQFPPEYQGNFFSGNPVSGRINRNSFLQHGSTPEGIQQPDFLVSDDPWFRPVDVKMGPDGALYVADFYNRIIGHYEVALDHPGRDRERGRIWRIVYTGNDHQVTPEDAGTDWSAAGLNMLLDGLDHADLRVRMLVADEIADRFGTESVEPVRALLDSGSPQQKAHGLWVLQRLDALDDASLTEHIATSEPLVRLHALRILFERPAITPDQRMETLAALQSDDPHLQRAAAEVLARFPETAALEPLIAMQSTTPDSDTHLAYTVRQALRDHLRNSEVLSYAGQESWSESESRALADAMVGVDEAGAASFLFDHLRRHEASIEARKTYAGHIARYLPLNEIDALVDAAKTSFGEEAGVQLDLYQAIRDGLTQRGGSLNASTESWGADLARRVIEAGEHGTPEAAGRLRFAAALAGELQIKDLAPALSNLVTATQIDIEARAAAAESFFKLDPGAALPTLSGRMMDGEETTPLRTRIASLLGGSTRADARQAAIEAFRDAPTQVQMAAATALANNPAGRIRLVEAAGSGLVSPRLLADPRVRDPLMAELPEDARMRLEQLTAGAVPFDRDRQRLIQQRLENFRAETASAGNGREVFARNCAACHEAGGAGGAIGPQLDGVGRRGELALAEKILAPNRNVTPGFQNFTLRLDDGSTRTGMLQREEGEALVFANFMGEEFIVPAQSIEEQTPLSYSLMPDNFYEAIDESDFHDLLGYLMTLR